MLCCSFVETTAYLQWRHPKLRLIRCHHLIIIIIIQAQSGSDFVFICLIEVCLEHSVQIEVALRTIINTVSIHIRLIMVRPTCNHANTCTLSLIKYIPLFHKRIHTPSLNADFIRVCDIIFLYMFHCLTAIAFVIQSAHEVLTCICTIFHIPAVQ